MQELADSIDQDLGPPTGHAIEPGVYQPPEHLGNRQLREPRQVDHLGRRQRVELECGIPLLDCAEQIFVPRERQVGVVPTLQEKLYTSDRNGLVDLVKELVEAEHVAVRRSDGPVERTERALGYTDVRVVDVPVDDVGDDPVRV